MGTVAAWIFVVGLMVLFACVVALIRLRFQLTGRAKEWNAERLAQYAAHDDEE